jgi:hypothetical protein
MRVLYYCVDLIVDLKITNMLPAMKMYLLSFGNINLLFPSTILLSYDAIIRRLYKNNTYMMSVRLIVKLPHNCRDPMRKKMSQREIHFEVAFLRLVWLCNKLCNFEWLSQLCTWFYITYVLHMIVFLFRIFKHIVQK